LGRAKAARPTSEALSANNFPIVFSLNFYVEKETVKKIIIGFVILTGAFFIGRMETAIGIWGWVVAPFGFYFVIRGRKELDANK
jgi:hypothetical protein